MVYIPKDCCLCDVCNAQLTDENFIATENCEWYEGWLYCMNCIEQYNPSSFLKMLMRISKGDDLSRTELAQPIQISFGEE